MGVTYRISVWDHEANDWEVPPRYQGVLKWGLRDAIRELYSEAWDSISILVEREDQSS